MTTKTTSPIKAYSIMARDFSDLEHHLGDVVARSAREAVRDARAEYGHRYRNFAAERIRLADIDDDDLRAEMAEWMDWQGVESR
jgi:thermostable 8-oxoguanine DNA glycosylase